jgi:hypothetical protein
MTQAAETVHWPEPHEAIEYLYEQGFSDGLPLVPPTRSLVDAMIVAGGRASDEELGEVPPKLGVATVEKVAINAAMAGCRPDYFPVVLAVVEAALDEALNLRGIQVTTHPAGPMVVVNGPVRSQIGINSTGNCFGPGFRANATIGRALRLIMINLGGGFSQTVDKSTFGHPGKYSFCFGENEEQNPWEPFHVEHGYSQASSAVTVAGADGPFQIVDYVHSDAKGLLSVFADSLATIGNLHMYVQGEMFIVFCPEHAATIAKSGFTKNDVRQFLHETARRRLGDLKKGGFYGRHLWPKSLDHENDETMMPLFSEPGDIKILVAGGVNKQSVVIPTWSDGHGRSRATMAEVRQK